MDKYTILQAKLDEIDLVKPLWEKLNQVHLELSPHFKARFEEMNWNTRISKLLEKSRDILIDYVFDNENENIVGYCISTIGIEDHNTGEIDSIFVDEMHRKSGLGKQLIERAIQWLKSKGTETQKLLVGFGNEQVFGFYEQFDFYPLHIVMQRIEK